MPILDGCLANIDSASFVEEVLGKLRACSFAELCELPKQQDINGPPGERRVTYCTWVDVLEDGAVRVVVQAYRRRWLGFGKMGASGFEMTSEGSIRDVPESEMYEYL